MSVLREWRLTFKRSAEQSPIVDFGPWIVIAGYQQIVNLCKRVPGRSGVVLRADNALGGTYLRC